jgi:Bacterial SH3 domain
MIAATRLTVFASLCGLLIAACGSKEPGTPTDASRAGTERAMTPVPAAAEPSAPEAAKPHAATPEPAASEPATPEPAAPSEAATTAAPAPRSAKTPAATSPPRPTAAAAAAPADTGSAMAPIPGTVTRQTELKAEPAPSARTLSTLAANTPVTITNRQGGWLRVTSGEARGWVRLLHVSSQPAASTSSARAELEAAARVATGRAGQGNVAVTTGIRGLDEKELREAKPNPEELARLESFGAQPAQAQAHAKSQSLERRQVPYPPPPQAR